MIEVFALLGAAVTFVTVGFGVLVLAEHWRWF